MHCKPCYNKGIKNGCPCIVEIRGTQGCALVGDPARAVGSCRDVAELKLNQKALMESLQRSGILEKSTTHLSNLFVLWKM